MGLYENRYPAVFVGAGLRPQSLGNLFLHAQYCALGHPLRQFEKNGRSDLIRNIADDKRRAPSVIHLQEVALIDFHSGVGRELLAQVLGETGVEFHKYEPTRALLQ
ncbi:Uncharacterised protein [uncultured archaeon]|nr:Uncharacterised protein [uncultured archaeon]